MGSSRFNILILDIKPLKDFFKCRLLKISKMLLNIFTSFVVSMSKLRGQQPTPTLWMSHQCHLINIIAVNTKRGFIISQI